MKPFEWQVAAGVAEAVLAHAIPVAEAMRSRSGTPPRDAVVFKAGGIDLVDLLKEGLVAPRRVVNLRAIPELRGIAQAPGGGLRVGATATLAEIAAHPSIRERYTALAEAAGGAASPQIRNVATLGGNLLQRPRCWYFRSRHHHCLRKGGATCFALAGENQYHAIVGYEGGCAMVHPSTAATALVALDARVELLSASGKRIVALDAFLRSPAQTLASENDLKRAEVLTAVVLPPMPGTLRSLHRRQGEIASFDWPLADVAIAAEMEDVTCRRAIIVLGAAAPVPHRARAAEQALAGQPVTEAVARRAAQAAIEGAIPLSANAYKLPIFEALVRRALLELAAPG